MRCRVVYAMEQPTLWRFRRDEDRLVIRVRRERSLEIRVPTFSAEISNNACAFWTPTCPVCFSPCLPVLGRPFDSRRTLPSIVFSIFP